MKCPKCSNMDTKVIDSRSIEWWQTIKRRRECEFCTNRFTTFERRWTTELIVIKKDWTKEMYDRQKLKKALLLSFAKRDIDKEELEILLNSLETQRAGEWNEVSSIKIWDDIVKSLKKIDAVAYVRFASVYKSFNNLEDFKKFID